MDFQSQRSLKSHCDIEIQTLERTSVLNIPVERSKEETHKAIRSFIGVK